MVLAFEGRKAKKKPCRASYEFNIPVPVEDIAARVRLPSSRSANARLHRWLRDRAAAGKDGK